MTQRRTQIVALGGGGFSMEPHNLSLDEYILAQSGAKRPRVCFLPTATGDDSRYLAGFYSSYCSLECKPTHLSLFAPPPTCMREKILSQDVVYVGGGNTRSMLALWREWGLDTILREAYEAGVVLAGLSAGSICWFEEGLSDYVPGQLNAIAGLGLLEGSHCPHYRQEPERRPAYLDAIAKGAIRDGIAADDGVGLHYINGALTHVVSSRPDVAAFHVRKGDRGAEELLVEPKRLPTKTVIA